MLPPSLRKKRAAGSRSALAAYGSSRNYIKPVIAFALVNYPGGRKVKVNASESVGHNGHNTGVVEITAQVSQKHGDNRDEEQAGDQDQNLERTNTSDSGDYHCSGFLCCRTWHYDKK